MTGTCRDSYLEMEFPTEGQDTEMGKPRDLEQKHKKKTKEKKKKKERKKERKEKSQ